MMQVELGGFVETGLEAIADFISQDNPTRAITFIQEIHAKIRLLARHPLVYHSGPRSELALGLPLWAGM